MKPKKGKPKMKDDKAETKKEVKAEKEKEAKAE